MHISLYPSVGRLIKATKYKQSHRDSSPSRLSFARPNNSKLGDHQEELQACEATLASKERELDLARINIFREGLTLRCKAMVECGWAWGEMGKAAIGTLENFDAEHLIANGWYYLFCSLSEVH